MTQPHLFFFLLSSAGLLAGCSTTPLEMDASHPASADAPEAPMVSARSTPLSDANTMRTRELLAQREQQTKAAESEKSVDEINTDAAAPRASSEPMKRMEDHETH